MSVIRYKIDNLCVITNLSSFVNKTLGILVLSHRHAYIYYHKCLQESVKEYSLSSLTHALTFWGFMSAATRLALWMMLSGRGVRAARESP